MRRTGPPRRRTRRLSKGSESCWPRGRLSDVSAWKKAGYQPAQLPDARQRTGQSPANHRPTWGKYSDHAQAHTCGAGPGDARSTCADVQVCNLLASDVDMKVPGTRARVVVGPVVGYPQVNAEGIVFSCRFSQFRSGGSNWRLRDRRRRANTPARGSVCCAPHFRKVALKESRSTTTPLRLWLNFCWTPTRIVVDVFQPPYWTGVGDR